MDVVDADDPVERAVELGGEIDLAACVEPKQFHELVGHYNSDNVFDPRATRNRAEVIEFIDRLPPAVILDDTPDAAGQGQAGRHDLATEFPLDD